MIDFNSKSRIPHPIAQLIDELPFPEGEKRFYLGASYIGYDCNRKIQFMFFNTPEDKLKTHRTNRIFYRGHEGEKWVMQWLIDAGLKVSGSQTGFKDGHFSGHCDGIILSGPEQFSPYPRIWENKVLGIKSMKEIHNKGLKEAKPEYYAQMQIYMAYLDITNPALFSVLEMDSMNLYFEDVPFNQNDAQAISDKAANIIAACDAGDIMNGISDDPDFYKCKMCSYRRRCHGV